MVQAFVDGGCLEVGKAVWTSIPSIRLTRAAKGTTMATGLIWQTHCNNDYECAYARFANR